MTFEIVIVFAVLLLAVVLFATEKLPVDVVALVVLSLLLISGLITAGEGFAGFSNTATVTVAAMFIISAGLFRTGAVDFLGGFVARIFQERFLLALLIVMAVVAVLSAFINNTPVIAIFLPILLSVAKDTGLSVSKILMPVSFASMFGGVCTLVGTSTNILVSSIAEKNGLPPFSMFEFAPLGLVMFAVGTAYMLTIGIRIIPERRGAGDLTESFALSEYLTEIVLLPGAASVGSKVREAPLVRELDVTILEIHRAGETIHPDGDTELRADDILVVRCNMDDIAALQERSGIRFKPQVKWGDESLTSDEYRLLEVVIVPTAGVVGSTLQRSNFREKYGGTVLAMRHKGKLMREKLSDTILSAGDVLLLEIHRDQAASLKRNNDFIVTSERSTVEFRRSKALIAVAIVAGVVIGASLNLAPIVVTATVGAVLLVLTQCITLEEAYEAIEWKIIFLLGGVLSLGVALEKTGAAALISNQLVGTVGSFGLIGLLSAFYLLTSVLTEMMSNNATAALLGPIAIATAAALGVSPVPFLVAVTFAASASFMTPVGYQTNTMIYGPGQYKFSDFIKVGGPLNLIFWLLATFLIPVFWKF